MQTAIETNPIRAIILLATEKASTLPTLPFDLVVKVTQHYIQENPEKILDSYHYIQNHISKKEKETLILESFRKIFQESINEEYRTVDDGEWGSEEETEKEREEREERNEEKEYSTNILDLVIYKSRKNKQILKNFSAMVFEIQDSSVEEEVRKTIFSKSSMDVLFFQKHNLFSLDLLKVLYKNEKKDIFTFLKCCSSSNIEILEYVLENEPSFEEIISSGECFFEFFEFAEKIEDLDMLEWLFSKGMELETEYYGDSSSVQNFLREKGLKFGISEEEEEFNLDIWKTEQSFGNQELGENLWE